MDDQQQTSQEEAPAEGAAVVTGPLSESVVLSEAAGGGNTFDILVIRPGISKNGRDYSAAVLRESAPLLDKVPAYGSFGTDHDRAQRGARAIVGLWTKGRYEEGVALPDGSTAEGLVARFRATDATLAETLRASLEEGRPDLIGWSIVGDGELSEAIGRKPRRVLRIARYDSVDPVIHPAAGGTTLRLVASAEDSSMNENETPVVKTEAPAAAAPAAPAADPKLVEAAVQAQIEAALGPVRTQAAVEAALAERALPAVAKDRVRKAAAGKTLDAAGIGALIEAEVEYLKAVAPTVIRESGQVTDVKNERDQIAEAFDAFFERRNGEHSVRKLYIAATGDAGFTGRIERDRISEAINSSTFAELLGDSIRKRMLAEYANSEYQLWRPIVDVVPLADFRTNHRTRMGGYGNLSTVAEGDPYTAITSPGDEEVTYAPAKRGNTEQITLETVVNDDAGLVRRIPVKLAGAAGHTLQEFAFDFMRSNATIYDSTALAHASHGNLGSAALDATSLSAARLAMRKQAELSSSRRLNIFPKFLVVPVDLEDQAFKLTATDREVASANNTLNVIRTYGLSTIVVPYWTDANNWWLVADPKNVPTIEIGFLGGREEPELFLQDEPTNGSVFSNDKLTWKIRHIYGGQVMDYRGFYGAIVA